MLFCLASCQTIGDTDPQDALDESLYLDPIVLDWTNEQLSDRGSTFIEDGEELKAYLNKSRAPIKEVVDFANVMVGAGALRLGDNRRNGAGLLTLKLKSGFYADAIALVVYPYHYQVYDYSTSSEQTIYDHFSVSINNLAYSEIIPNDEDAPDILTYVFDESTEELSIQTLGYRGYFFSLSIYQSA